MNALRCFNKKMLVAATASVVLGMGMAGQAQASAYAFSSNDITNFRITGIQSFDAVATTSDSRASHSTIPPISVTDSDPTNALQSFVGNPPAPGQNNFLQWNNTSNSYGRGDAEISNADVLQGTGAAANVAESYLSHGMGPMTATGGGDNFLSGRFTLQADTALGISFTADPHMHVTLTEGKAPTDFALAGLDFVVTISDLTGTVMDEWVDTNLNHAISALVAGDSFEWHPAGNYSWTSAILPGNASYNIDIRMGERVSTSVPEPGTMFLLGGGLAGLAFATRRRTAAKA